MFDKATRLKLRFESLVGLLHVEDLWDLPLTALKSRPNLDDIARAIHRQLKNDEDVSFVHKDRKSDETIQLRFDIVKHIIDVKLAEKDALEVERVNAEKKQRILAIISQKEDEHLHEISIDDLKKMMADL